MSTENLTATQSEIDSRPETLRDSRGEDPPIVLTLEGFTKEFGSERAVADLTLSVHEGEVLTLLGPSGCG